MLGVGVEQKAGRGPEGQLARNGKCVGMKLAIKERELGQFKRDENTNILNSKS